MRCADHEVPSPHLQSAHSPTVYIISTGNSGVLKQSVSSEVFGGLTCDTRWHQRDQYACDRKCSEPSTKEEFFLVSEGNTERSSIFHFLIDHLWLPRPTCLAKIVDHNKSDVSLSQGIAHGEIETNIESYSES